ncbi:MAG: carboxypeptidase-like regulatory domain-containing protein, partial [Planctomycetota bacterium]
KDGASDEKAGPPAKSAEANAESLDARPLDGILFVLRDLASGHVTYRRVNFSMIRPRRFLQPRVRFDANSSRIVVQLATHDRSMLPADGPVNLQCRLDGFDENAVQGKLRGVISRTHPETRLFVNIPRDTYNTVRLLIDVDGFPRAFRFDVPCGNDSAEIEEISDRLDVRLSTDSREGYLPAMEAVPLRIKLDAPPGTFDGQGTHLRYGLDLSQSGVPSESTSQAIRTDRQVSVAWANATPVGTIELKTSAEDFLVQVPVERLENIDFQIAASLSFQQTERSLPSLPLFMDSKPPVIGPIRLSGPSRVLPKQTMQASVIVSDSGCGVQSVEAVLVKDGVEDFPEEGEIVEALALGPRQWRFELPTGKNVGRKRILVRGIDRVGNVSAPTALDVEVASMSLTGSVAKASSHAITGQVSYRGEPLNGATIQLNSDGPNSTAMTKRTGATGEFRFEGLKPGSYRLEAKAVVQNRVRLAKKSLDLSPNQQAPLPVPVELR